MVIIFWEFFKIFNVTVHKTYSIIKKSIILLKYLFDHYIVKNRTEYKCLNKQIELLFKVRILKTDFMENVFMRGNLF